jgi:cobalamin biosynthesis protein CbiG
MKEYSGRVPACGVFCGGCPTYVRDIRPCPGAGINHKRCEGCKTFHLCCKEKGITHCYQCTEFPCRKFRDFSKRWLKYGQDFVENQKILKEMGTEGFIHYYNEKIKE